MSEIWLNVGMIGDASPTVTTLVERHPVSSVILTVYVPAGRFETVFVLLLVLFVLLIILPLSSTHS